MNQIIYSLFLSNLFQVSEDEPVPIPPPRRHRPRKAGSTPTRTPGALPPPSQTPRRHNQQGQLIDIDNSPSTPPAKQHPHKPTRTFPSPSNINVATGNDAPLIQVDSQESLPKSPSDSNLFVDLRDGSDDESSRLDVNQSLKGSNSSPNLIDYRAGNASAQNRTAHVGNNINPLPSGSGVAACVNKPMQSVDTSQPNPFDDSFVPPVSASISATQENQPHALGKANSTSVANPFSDSFVVTPSTIANVSKARPASGSYNSASSTTSPRRTSLQSQTQSATAMQTPTRRVSSTMTPTHPAYVSHDLLQPITSMQKPTVQSTSSSLLSSSKSPSASPSKADPKSKADPFADLVSMQFKGNLE